MIILITGWFPIYKNGIDTEKLEFVVSHGVDEYTGKNVIMPCEQPWKIDGAYYCEIRGEWVV